ncbi:MAG: DUF5686 and carboxypeptidase regulatory-like domain-containing protein [Flavobacteriales bacterium]|nr:DUF5686 and carboxypeptidase regulatory-like domain-containing protein [Flavobacteriales bacterium]
MVALIKRLLVLSFILSSFDIQAQSIRGTLTDEEGTPVPYANVYKKNSTYGVATDHRGKYYLELSKGQHTIVFSFIGYNTIEKKIDLNQNQNEIIDLVMTNEGMELLTVEVVSDRKDKGKEIIKQAIENAPKRRKQFNSYECDTYVKTSLVSEVLKVSKSDSTNAEKDSTSIDSVGHKENMNLIEKVSKTYFELPNKHKEIILATHDYAEKFQSNAEISVSFSEDHLAPAARIETNPYIIYESARSMELNFYKPLMHLLNVTHQPMLSPLAPDALLNYRYLYRSSFMEDGKKIYELEVQPLFAKDALFYGRIFIEDSTWAIKSVDLSINESALLFAKEIKIIQNYKWDDSITVPFRREIIYRIKDGRKMVHGNSRIHHEQFKFNQNYDKKFFGNEVITYLPEAFDQSESYWMQARPLRLLENELQFIQERDSINNYHESPEYLAEQDSIYNHLKIWDYLLNGIRHKNSFRKNRCYLDPLINQVQPFGVGGYRHRLAGGYRKEFQNNQLLRFDGDIDYGFTNKDIKGNAGIGYTYMPKKFLSTYIEAGDIYDFINNFASIQSTFSRSNYVRKRFGLIRQKIELFNGLYTLLEFQFSDRNSIEDIELANWSNDVFGSLNTPIAFERYKISELTFELLYRFNQKYIIKKNKKVIIGTDFPELRFKYRKGLPGLFGSEVNFDYLELKASDFSKLRRMGTLAWKVTLGSFVNKKNLRIIEYKYFRGSDPWFFSDPLNSLQLLPATLNTPNAYLSFGGIHHFDGAIMNKVPILNWTKVSLVAGGGGLSIPDQDFSHAEVFGGIERIIRIKKQLFRLSAFTVAASNSINRSNLEFKFGISYFNTFTGKWNW